MVCREVNLTINNVISGWFYYNHAAIPSNAPHETPDLAPLIDGSIWRINGKKPLLVRYTTDWDCGYDTGWWYIIKDAPFEIESLSKNSRKHIRGAFRKVYVKKVDPLNCIDDLYECYHAAFLKYKQADNEASAENFRKGCLLSSKKGIEYWAGFAIDSNKMIGYMTIKSHDCWAEIQTAKFHPDYLNLLVSDALYATVLDNYLNKLGMSYVSSGSRSINHVTNTQEYKESHFGYRKCFCKLHIIYRQPLKLVVALTYPFRRIINVLGNKFGVAHHLSAILKMEEIARSTGK